MYQLVEGTEQVNELGPVFSPMQITKGNESNDEINQTSEHKETN